MNANVLAGVKMTTDCLTTQELVQLFNVVAIGWDPRDCTGYEKAKALFVQPEGTRMHQSIQDALETLVHERIGR